MSDEIKSDTPKARKELSMEMRLLIAFILMGAVLFVLLNVMLTILIVQPITQLSMTAEQMSKGRLDVPDFSDKGRDEVSQLGQAFNRMSDVLSERISKLEEDCQQLRTILSGMVEGVAALDAEQRILFANERACGRTFHRPW